MSQQDDHWLARPSTIKLLTRISIAVLVLLVALEIPIKIKGYFSVDSWFGFGAVYGFLACLAMVLFAKGLGFILKRPEDYYAEEDNDA